LAANLKKAKSSRLRITGHKDETSSRFRNSNSNLIAESDTTRENRKSKGTLVRKATYPNATKNSPKKQPVHQKNQQPPLETRRNPATKKQSYLQKERESHSVNAATTNEKRNCSVSEEERNDPGLKTESRNSKWIRIIGTMTTKERTVLTLVHLQPNTMLPTLTSICEVSEFRLPIKKL
jgi:hypothetical protein